MEEQKRQVSAIFNTVASGYDNSALRFFSNTAASMVDYLQPHRGWKVLDVATGTGALAIALAQVVGESGRVIGIDLSEGMLSCAEKKRQKIALDNVDLLQMDAESLEFQQDYFNAVTCSFGLFFMPDMLKALAQWRRVTRPGGTILFSSFTENAFADLASCYMEDLQAMGVDLSTKTFASERLKEAAVCRDLLRDAGLQNVTQAVRQMGYHLRDAGEWWKVVQGSAMRGLLALLDESRHEEFRQQHLERIAKRVTDDGLWMDVEVRFTSGQVAQ